jgi:hypothetical protein
MSRVRDRVGRARFQASSIVIWFNRPTSWTIASYALLFFALLFVRRSAQLLHPQVWDEEGLRILPDLIDHGAASILAPLNGYLVVISRLVGFIAFSMSFAGYPLITTVCDWAFTIAVLIAIAISPTVLRGGVLLALAAMLVPSDPEVFGVPLYEFWWSGLLIVVAAFWRPGARGTVWRCAFVALGGLSSPIIVLVLPLFLGRLMAWWKDSAERIVTGIAVLCCAIQIDALWRSHTVPQASIHRASGLAVTLQKFIGDYVVGSFGRFGIADTDAWQWIAVALSITIIVAAFAVSRRNAVVFAALAYLIVGSIALSIARVDVFIIDPSGNAPRYFFYPFIFEGWLFLQIALLADNRLVKIAATALLGLVLIDAVPTLSRSAADLRWSENVAQCDAAGDDQRYLIPFEFVGSARSTFELALTGRQCRALARRDLFLKAGILPTQRSPYRRYDLNARDPTGNQRPDGRAIDRRK